MSKNIAVVLARVSSRTQEDGYSLESQLKLLRTYCENKGYAVHKEFRIAETASKAQERTVFNQLLKYIDDHETYHLIVEKTDRFTRNLKDAVAIDDWMHADEDRALHAVKEGLIVHKNAKSDVKFMWNIHLAVAKKYTDNLREETMKGWAEKLAQGWMPAPPPPGYKTVVKDGKKIHVPDQKTANAVKQAFKLYLQDNQCIRSIGEELHKMGVTTKRNRPFTKSNVHKMLKNPFYMGIILFDGKEYPGAQQPLITEDLYNLVQTKLSRKRPKVQAKHDHALKGFLKCTYCKKTITWQKQKGHLYGACQRKLEDCRKKKFVREDKVHENIQERLDKLVCPSKPVMDWVIGMLNDDFESVTDNKDQTIAHIDLEITRVERMDEMLYDDKLSGEITPERYKTKHDEFAVRIKELGKQKLDFDDVSKEKHDEFITILQLSQQAGQLYRELEEVHEKRVILTKLFKEIVVNDDSISVIETELARIIRELSSKSRRIMKDSKNNNQTIKKDPDYSCNESLSEQEMLLRSVWCRRKDSNLHVLRH